MKKTILSICELMLIVAFISCQATKPAFDAQNVLSVAQEQSVLDSTSNIHIRVNVEPAIASTPQDVFLYTHYDCNTYLLDSIRTDGSTTRWLSIEEESAYRYSRQSMTRSLQSFNHQLKVFLFPGNWQIEWANELYHSNDNSVSTNYFSDLSISYRTKTFEAGVQCSNILNTRNYHRHYTTSYTDIVVNNQLRPREFLARVFFNI